MSEPLRSIEPATGAILWEGVPGDVSDEVIQVEESWPAWAALPFANRIEIVRRFANAVRQAEDALAELISRETGRPLWDSRAEVADLAKRADLAVSATSERAGQRRLEGAMGARLALRHRPHGVMAVITPHVFPAQIPSDHIAAALLAGNGVVFKPSEKTPATGAALVQLYHEAGLPPGLLRCLVGGPETGAALAAHPDVDAVLFTGSTHNGLSIARACIGQPDKLVALGMGSNNPIIAWDVHDIASAAALIVQSAFAMSGQNCLSARRLIVRDSLADLLVGEVAALTDRLILDQPHADVTPYLGPLIDMDAADGLTDSFLYMMSNGGKPIRHMKRPHVGLPFVTPGIIDMTEMEQLPDIELFGPLLQVIRVAGFEEAVMHANDTRYGLSAALVGGGPEHYDYFWANCRAGIVNWNRPTTAVPAAAPIGGTGLSGNHRPYGSYAADQCAYPVVSSALDQPRAAIGIGMRQSDHAPAQAE